LHHVWGYVGFAAETMIFMLAGMITGINTHKAEDEHLIDWDKPDSLLVFFNYLMCHVIRFSMISLFWPLLNRLGYGMSF